MQYLIKTITHDTGEIFRDVVKARENEVFTLVDAESEDEAIIKYKVGKVFRNIKCFIENNKILKEIRKDSE